MKKLLLVGALLMISLPAWADETIKHWNLNMVTAPVNAMICPKNDGNLIEYYFRATDTVSGTPLAGLTVRVWLQDYTSSQAVFFCPVGNRLSTGVEAVDEGGGYYRARLRPQGGVNRTTQTLWVVFEAISPSGWVEKNFWDLDVNSPDLNGDLTVNVSDTTIYTQILYGGGGYSLWLDFNHDGLNNLTDTAMFAQHNAHSCW